MIPSVDQESKQKSTFYPCETRSGECLLNLDFRIKISINNRDQWKKRYPAKMPPMTPKRSAIKPPVTA